MLFIFHRKMRPIPQLLGKYYAVSGVYFFTNKE